MSKLEARLKEISKYEETPEFLWLFLSNLLSTCSQYKNRFRKIMCGIVLLKESHSVRHEFILKDLLVNNN